METGVRIWELLSPSVKALQEELGEEEKSRGPRRSELDGVLRLIAHLFHFTGGQAGFQAHWPPLSL